MIDELFAEFHENPYGLFVLTTFENARIADEVIRIRRKEQNLTQTKLSEGILEPESYSRFERGKRRVWWARRKSCWKDSASVEIRLHCYWKVMTRMWWRSTRE